MNYAYTKIFFVGLSLLISFLAISQTKSPTEKVKDAFKLDIRKFHKTARILFGNSKKYIADSTTKLQMQIDFKNARLAFKNVEFLAEYYAPGTSKQINSPFLYKSNEEEPSKAPIKPEGFQAIEDILFAADTVDKYDLETIAFRLMNNAERLYFMATSYEFTDANIWWASRLHLLRIMSQGVTGFDSPSAQYSVYEARVGLKSIKNCWQNYFPDTTASAWIETKNIFNKADIYLSKNTNFARFDRLKFIVDYLNPLYSKGSELQKKLNIDYLSEPTAIRQESNNLFAADTWNPHFFQSEKTSFNSIQHLKAELGKILFFDPILSSNGKRSCASCHNPANGFAQKLAKSMAMDGKKSIKRNAPTLLNASLQAKMFADARINFLEEQIQDVVFSPDELHGNFKEMALKLKTSDEYKKLFAAAFVGTGETEISSFAIIKSIAEYERTLISLNSRFDKYVNGNKKMLNKSEIRGFNIFSGKGLCATCHFTPLFNGSVPPHFLEGELEVLGVPSHPSKLPLIIDDDKGRGYLTAIAWQNFSFKTPTVRNIALTAPYMHNGAYKTLEEVVDFYNKGGGKGLGLNVPNQTLPFDNLNLTIQEQKDLVNFMKALTDTNGLTSKPKYLPKVEGFDRKIGGEY